LEGQSTDNASTTEQPGLAPSIIDPTWPTRPRELAVLYRQARDDGQVRAQHLLFALIQSCEKFDEFWIFYWRLVVKDEAMVLCALGKFLPQFTPDRVNILSALMRCYGVKHAIAGILIQQRIRELTQEGKLT